MNSSSSRSSSSSGFTGLIRFSTIMRQERQVCSKQLRHSCVFQSLLNDDLTISDCSTCWPCCSLTQLILILSSWAASQCSVAPFSHLRPIFPFPRSCLSSSPPRRGISPMRQYFKPRPSLLLTSRGNFISRVLMQFNMLKFLSDLKRCWFFRYCCLLSSALRLTLSQLNAPELASPVLSACLSWCSKIGIAVITAIDDALQILKRK